MPSRSRSGGESERQESSLRAAGPVSRYVAVGRRRSKASEEGPPPSRRRPNGQLPGIGCRRYGASMQQDTPSTESSAQDPAKSGSRRIVRRLRALHRVMFVAAVDHQDVEARVVEDGGFRGRYGFMVVMACAIATLGLLLSSPAVIIGAMLISPLMGPIMLFGFSLAWLDFQAFRRSSFALLVGILMALAVSFAIVKLSPLTQVTPEILARTRPNLFDLLVAVFSGLAGAYAVIHRKGETIVGVAIATALMPPLAVVGFGLAHANRAIAGGAFFLFMTNLLAIALSATVLAGFHGFSGRQGRTTSVSRALLILVVFAGLSGPLAISLRRIAFEGQVSVALRSELESKLGRMTKVGDFAVRFTEETIFVRATVLTREYEPALETQLQVALAERIDRTVEFDLDQVIVDKAAGPSADELWQKAQSSLTAPIQAQLAQINRQQRLYSDFRTAAPFRVQGTNLDLTAKVATLYAGASAYLNLAAYREIESELHARYPDWVVHVVPSPQALPPVPFETGSTSVVGPGREALGTIEWALRRWGIGAVDVVGYASSVGSRRLNRTLAQARARAVAAELAALGFEARPYGEFRKEGQDAVERVFGTSRFQRVDVRLGVADGPSLRDLPVVPTDTVIPVPTSSVSPVAKPKAEGTPPSSETPRHERTDAAASRPMPADVGSTPP